ncbi:hypothetical protein GCM10011396_01210 [Undibacterium terreum]|uniref:Uncharacterized protein n=1 Tax=Undibacterium terreum TaxID=1224302 RepID=A0A916U5B3_9BURK|nr:hypothetical protein GCM10011396_01210 [Undibacterium terreum]
MAMDRRLRDDGELDMMVLIDGFKIKRLKIIVVRYCLKADSGKIVDRIGCRTSLLALTFFCATDLFMETPFLVFWTIFDA